MKTMPVSELRAGMTIELTGAQQLWKTRSDPWTMLTAGSQLLVVSIEPVATGRLDRQPFEIRLRADDGVDVDLEVGDGQELMAVVDGSDTPGETD